MADQRQKIIASVFSRRNAAGDLEESYVSHIKIWEDAGPEGGGRKPRYILLSQASNGSGFIHKSKLNTNGSYSVGKTWNLPELRGVQVVNPLAFNITLSRTYRWQTENEVDQLNFLEALILLFRSVSRGAAPLQVEGIEEPTIPRVEEIRQNDLRRSPSPPTTRAAPKTQNRLVTQNDREANRVPSPTPSQPRTGLPARPTSPANSHRSYGTTQIRTKDLGQHRGSPPSPSTIRSQVPRNVSNAGPPQAPLNRQASRLTQSSMSVARDAPNNLSRSSFDADTPKVSAQPPRQPPAKPDRARTQSARGPNDSNDVGGLSLKRDQNARISFFDPTNQVLLDRLLTGGMGGQSDTEGDEENTQATMANVEEMLEGYEWASDDIISGRKSARGAGDLIEARLLDELMALDKANIHSFVESDDRIAVVLKFMDEAVSELDNMDSLLSSYKIHLNAVSDDISYIQSQNRGLQVQTQNQRALLGELENLLQTVHVDQEALITLTQESLEKPASIQRLEEAAADLYKALQAGRDTEMAATMEKLEDYRTHNAQFCKRMFDFLSIMFSAQSTLLLGDTEGLTKPGGGRRPTVVQHQDMEAYLGRYAGLMLYLKEMDEIVYGKLCAAYFSAASELHSTQTKALLTAYLSLTRKASEEDVEQGLGATLAPQPSKGASIRRAGTLIRSPMEGRNKDKDKVVEGELRAAEAFDLALHQIASLIYRESEFITDFLQINDFALTYADYMGLDNYFRRQAARAAGLSQSTMKLSRGAMDLTFGFVPEELKKWLDSALVKDKMEIVGLIVVIERSLIDAGERSNQYLLGVLGKQHTRLKGLFDRHVNEQTKGVEQTKLTSKKRKGIASFVRQFPVYVGRVEDQLIGADGLEIRTTVNDAYERIVQTMFDSLKQMAKMEGEDEDKGQLNYHVILIENMHHFVAETSQTEIGSVAGFLRRAEDIYEENLSAYVKIVIRRPFSKIIDFFEGVERVLKTGSATDVVNNTNYNKSAFKKVTKEYNTKDIKKHIDNLFKRVEKHFTEASEKSAPDDGSGIPPGTVMVGVWKACEDELLRITDFFSKRISQCYSETGISLEYSAADVEAAFKRHRIGA